MSEQLQSEIGLSAIGNTGSKVMNDSSSASNAWNVNFTNGNLNYNNKTNTNRVRAVAPVVSSATPEVVYDIPFLDIIIAWLDCERTKRTSNSCTKFRWHAARDLVELWEQIRTGTYRPKASMCFIVTHPVHREVFAGAFRDRVVHHWEGLRLEPLLEQFFQECGNASMNCRKGYGSLSAVTRMAKMLYDYTEGYTRDDCVIVGGDFANFFMSLDHNLLWEMGREFLQDRYFAPDRDAFLYLCCQTIFHRPQDNCFKRSPDSAWDPLPARKSLFHTPRYRGEPIGILPSQLWANFMGAVFSWYIMYHKGISSFLIFVDDWRALVRSEDEGRALINDARRYLADQLHITLHPDKTYIQHYTKGTRMVGAVVKPRRIYVTNRTRGAFITKMLHYNHIATTHAIRVELLPKLRATINSYLGLMCHYNSYKVRRRIAEEYILPVWSRYLYFHDEFRKCSLRRAYDAEHNIRRQLRSRRFAERFIRPRFE